jgi:hypothetical protein
MSDPALQDLIREDIREAPKQTVIYLEGKTDTDILFALLGLLKPSDGLHQGVLVKGLRDEGQRRGSGSTAVTARVAVATRFNIPGVFGIVDGDGSPLGTLASKFDSPYPGPLFYWKAYCIENQLAKTGWPPIRGVEPDWQAELSKYGPYVALNRIGAEVRSILKDLGLEKYTNPILGGSLKASDEILASLAIGTTRFQSYHVGQRFQDEITAFEETIQRSLDEVYALLNGKWLVKHMAPTLTKREPDQCQFDWIAHAISVDGLPEVRKWWERVTGSAP